jgi:hypothetical protein
MTLTISQLQQMYGTTSVQTLRSANPSGASAKSDAAVDVLDAASNDIIPDDDNPLFMTVEQRAEAHQREEMVRNAKYAQYLENVRNEETALAVMTPEEQAIYYEEKQQYELELYRNHQAKEAVRLEKLKASLPPRISGALGEDLRLKGYDLKEANFLEAMKVKYAHMKDAFIPPKPESEPLPELFGAFPTTSRYYKAHEAHFEEKKAEYIARREEVSRNNEEKLQKWRSEIDQNGNNFVIRLTFLFGRAATDISTITSTTQSLENAKRDLEDGNTRPFLREQIIQQQAVVDKAWQNIRTALQNIKNVTDTEGYREQTAQYFADYTQFRTGTAYDLNEVYRKAGAA